MKKNSKKFSFICILIILLISTIFIIGHLKLTSKNTNDLFSKKIIHNFGMGLAYEIDLPQIKNDYSDISIDKTALFLYRKKGNSSIRKIETLFENLPPETNPFGSIAGTRESYTLISETDNTKLYEKTHTFSYNSPDGVISENDLSYVLYRKEDTCTLEITGNDKNKILKLSSFITPTNQQKSLEEEFQDITVLDGRILDTSRIKIDRIFSEYNHLDIEIKIDDNLIDALFLPKNYKDICPELDLIESWDLITTKDNYKIYHGYFSDEQYDALKISKDGTEYFVYLTIPYDLYKNGKANSEVIEKLTQEILNNLK